MVQKEARRPRRNKPAITSRASLAPGTTSLGMSSESSCGLGPECCLTHPTTRCPAGGIVQWRTTSWVVPEAISRGLGSIASRTNFVLPWTKTVGACRWHGLRLDSWLASKLLYDRVNAKPRQGRWQVEELHSVFKLSGIVNLVGLRDEPVRRNRISGVIFTIPCRDV